VADIDDDDTQEAQHDALAVRRFYLFGVFVRFYLFDLFVGALVWSGTFGATQATTNNALCQATFIRASHTHRPAAKP